MEFSLLTSCVAIGWDFCICHRPCQKIIGFSVNSIKNMLFFTPLKLINLVENYFFLQINSWKCIVQSHKIISENFTLL